MEGRKLGWAALKRGTAGTLHAQFQGQNVAVIASTGGLSRPFQQPLQQPSVMGSLILGAYGEVAGTDCCAAGGQAEQQWRQQLRA